MIASERQNEKQARQAAEKFSSLAIFADFA